MVLVDTSVWADFLRAKPTPQVRALKELLADWSCRRAGRTPRSSNDCLIARIAIEHALFLLHDDRDFEAIAAVVPELRLYPVR